MTVKTVADVIGDLKELYQERFGVPHSNKAYQEQSRSIKALVGAVGEKRKTTYWQTLGIYWHVRMRGCKTLRIFLV